jgi:hypothetical protein
MKKEVIEIEAKVDEAITDIKKLFDTMLTAEQEAQKQTDELNKNVKSIGKTSKKSAKGVEGIGKSVKGIGTAMKAAGIGLIVAAFVSLKEVFTSNQKVADALSTVMETVSLVFNEFANVIIDTYESVSEATDGFDALGKVIMGILKVAITPLKLGFFGIKLGIQEAQLIWEKSFFGDKNQNTINELNSSILETKLALVKTGEEAIQASKDIANNIGEAIGEVGSFVTTAIDEVSKISIKGAYENAKAIVQLKNSAEIAAASQARLVEQYDRQAEKLRQIRDNDLKSIEERKKANDELGLVLEEQEKAMIKQAKLQVAAAAADANKNNSIENQKALIEALANEEGILAQIEGFRSEQQANKVALDKEEIELINSKKEANSNLSIEEKRFVAEQEKNELKKLEKLRAVLEEEKIIELERLQNKIDSYAEGTQYRLDAEIEYNAKKQEIDQALITNETEAKILKAEKDLEEKQLIIDNDLLAFEIRRAALDEQRNLILADETLTEEQRTKMLKDNYIKQVELERNRVAEKQKALSDIISIVGAETAIGKAALIAKQILMAKELFLEIQKTITFSTQAAARSVVAVAEGTAQTAKIGFPQNIPMLIGYAAQAAGIIGAIKSAVKSSKASGISLPSTPSISTSSISQPTTQQAQSPNFNVVGSSGTNQLASAIGSQTQQPIQAYVVSNDVTTGQSLDRNIIESASIG